MLLPWGAAAGLAAGPLVGEEEGDRDGGCDQRHVRPEDPASAVVGTSGVEDVDQTDPRDSSSSTGEYCRRRPAVSLPLRPLPTEIALLALDVGNRVYIVSFVRDRSEHRA